MLYCDIDFKCSISISLSFVLKIDMSVFIILKILIESNLDSVCRPRYEFFRRPSLPTSGQFTYRLLINILYFLKNYTILLFCIAAILCTIAPIGLVSLGIIFYLHSSRGKEWRHILRISQVTLLSYLISKHGVKTVLILNSLCCLLIGAHAMFTPYTDEASLLYDKLAAKVNGPIPTPRTPVKRCKAN